MFLGVLLLCTTLQANSCSLYSRKQLFLSERACFQTIYQEVPDGVTFSIACIEVPGEPV